MNIKVVAGEYWTHYMVFECTDLIFETWLRGNVSFDEIWRSTYSGHFEGDRNTCDGEVPEDGSGA